MPLLIAQSISPGGMDSVALAFRHTRGGRHRAVIDAALAILHQRLASGETTEGYRKDGPVSVAQFELGQGNAPELREARALRQRQASDAIEPLLARLG